MEQQEKQPTEILPVFVGVPDPAMIELIQEAVKDQNVELSVMGDDMYASSFHFWKLSKATPEEKEAIVKEQRKSGQYLRLLNVAVEISTKFPEGATFHQLKYYFNSTDKRMTNSQLENLINYLCDENLMNSPAADMNKKFIKRLFIVAVTTSERLQVAQARLSAINTKREFTLAQIDNEIKRLENDIAEYTETAAAESIEDGNKTEATDSTTDDACDSTKPDSVS